MNRTTTNEGMIAIEVTRFQNTTKDTDQEADLIEIINQSRTRNLSGMKAMIHYLQVPTDMTSNPVRKVSVKGVIREVQVVVEVLAHPQEAMEKMLDITNTR